VGRLANAGLRPVKRGLSHFCAKFPVKFSGKPLKFQVNFSALPHVQMKQSTCRFAATAILKFG
jgi:hypothetical protein